MSLNARLNFDTLIPTSGNHAALDVCREFAISPCLESNVLLLHGGTAVGKSHLLHAMRSMARQRQSDGKVILITCEAWLIQQFTAIRSKPTEEFRENYRGLELLLVDDVQILNDRPITQRVFSNFLASLVIEGTRVASAHSGLLTDIPCIAESHKRLVLEISQPTVEEMISILARRFPNIPLEAVEAACAYDHRDIRRAEGRLNSFSFAEEIKNLTSACLSQQPSS